MKLVDMIPENDKYNKCGVVILAAGLSKRMGRPKAFLNIDESKVFIDQVIGEYTKFGCGCITVVTSKFVREWKTYISAYKYAKHIKFIENSHPEFERFYSVKLGLSVSGNVDFCFIQNVDNPFVDKNLLNIIYESRYESGYIVPTWNKKGGHPILLSKKVIEGILADKNYSANLKEVLKRFKRIDIEAGTDKILINIDTYEEYQKQFAYAGIIEETKYDRNL